MGEIDKEAIKNKRRRSEKGKNGSQIQHAEDPYPENA